MKPNYQSTSHDHDQSWWDGSQRSQRLLANLVYPRLAYFDRVASNWHGLEVLDLGCGGGFMSEALARRGARVTGVDPTMASLETAREHAWSQGLEIVYREGVGENIPLDTHSVDRVVCVDVLEHVQDLEKVLSEIGRVIRPQGIFLFGTVNRNWFSRLLTVTVAESILKIIPHGTHDADKFIRPSEMQHLLERNGFAVERDRFVGVGPIGVNRSLDFVFGLMPVTWMMYLGYAIAA
ncbi:MAG: bifunctional 2-polyprenyl-6-hydroxyphenol methylase/3-demethylubiquinol 3-O-methyltransferase UbiG [Syntrophales bacterium LBB04]|nr:bifunctional 2-polyprenyl-6-hydroxyphenol methylase/3-demethylubiquinol 3-O-methyltransferase UbiG [Syntrophales bacterium LBB04]